MEIVVKRIAKKKVLLVYYFALKTGLKNIKNLLKMVNKKLNKKY